METSQKLVYRCPECRGAIIWSLNNLRPGAESQIRCANNLVSSKIDWKPRISQCCFWTGLVIRQKNGDVRLFYDDGWRMLTPILNS